MNKVCYVVTIPETIEAFFVPQLNYLSENGYDVTVICSPGGKLSEKLNSSIRRIPIQIPRGVSVSGMLKAIKRLRAVFKEENFDLIQYSTPNAALCAAIAAKQAKCPVRNYHLMGFRYQGASGAGRSVLKFLEKLTCRLSTHIECVSRSNLDLGIEDGIFPAEKAVVVWNGSTGGIDLNRFSVDNRQRFRQQIRSKLGFSEDDFVYGFVGRITADKGVNELLEAYFALDDDSKLLMVGNVENEDTLNKTLFERAKKCERIKFTGAVEDIQRYYAAMDVLLLPSYREGFGNVVIEAAACGTPTIVSDIPGPTDAIEAGSTAITVRVKDPADLERAMSEVRACDYASMGMRAAAYSAERFDSEVLCRKILERKASLLGREMTEL